MTFLNGQETAEMERKVEALASTLLVPNEFPDGDGSNTSASTPTFKESSHYLPRKERAYHTFTFPIGTRMKYYTHSPRLRHASKRWK